MMALNRMKLIILSPRFLIAVLLMAVLFVVWRLFVSDSLLIGTILAIGLIIIYIFMYRSDIRKLIKQR
jgi:hypothetical protein